MTWDEVGYVISSTYRISVMKHLAESPKTPSSMAKPHTDMEIAHVSRALKNLRERDLVELLVDEDRKKGRFYGLTADGEEVWEVVKEQENATQ